MKKTKKMTTKNKYAHITTLDELEAAQKHLKKRIRRKRDEVEYRIFGLRDDYSAPHLFGMTMRATRTDGMFLQAIRFLKKKIADL